MVSARRSLVVAVLASSQLQGVVANNATGKPACVCQDSWGYPKSYEKGVCVGPFQGCPDTACDSDSDGPWCVVKNSNCKGVNEYTVAGIKEYFAYCSPSPAPTPPVPPPTGPLLQPDDTRIRYIGRFDFANPKVPRFAWSMAGLSVTFSGSKSIVGKFTFPKAGGRLRVVVDGKTTGFVSQSGVTDMKLFTLADNLDTGKHTLEVYKVDEDSVMTFGGVQLDSGEFDSAPVAPTRRLEFIGDSDTAGYCADGNPNSGDKDYKVEDAYVTWAQQLARSLGAEPMVEAVSGWGVTTSSSPIQKVLDYSIRGSKTAWDYSKWTPDAIIILIGPNDEFTKRLRAKAQVSGGFVAAYKSLMDQVNTNYKNAKSPPKIIHVCGGSMNGFDPCDDIQTANTQFNAEGNAIKGYYTTITKAHWTMINKGGGTSAYNGCDSHYNEKGHNVLAQDILPQVQKIMGWQQSADTINAIV